MRDFVLFFNSVAVLDVGVGHKLDAVLLKALECDHLGVLRDAGGVEGEGHLDLAVALLGREGGLCGDGLAVHLKSLAGDEVLVGHTVGDGRLVVSRHVLVAVRAIHGGGADFRLDDGHLLVHVGLIGVLSDEGATIIVQLLIDRDGLAAQLDGVDGELHDLEPGGGLGRESLLHGDGVAGGVQQDVAGRGVVKLRRQLVVAVREEVGVPASF